MPLPQLPGWAPTGRPSRYCLTSRGSAHTPLGLQGRSAPQPSPGRIPAIVFPRGPAHLGAARAGSCPESRAPQLGPGPASRLAPPPPPPGGSSRNRPRHAGRGCTPRSLEPGLPPRRGERGPAQLRAADLQTRGPPSLPRQQLEARGLRCRRLRGSQPHLPRRRVETLPSAPGASYF